MGIGNHPNLLAACELSNQAIQKIEAAQIANDFDMQGHAAKAIQSLQAAYNEVEQAAVWAG